MSTESNTLVLDHKVEIRIPSLCGVCKEPLPQEDCERVLSEVKKLFLKWFGGAEASSNRKGLFRHDDGTFVEEPVEMVFSNCTQDSFEEHYVELTQLAVHIADELSQETVALTIHQGMSRDMPCFLRSDPKALCIHKRKGMLVSTHIEEVPIRRAPHTMEALYAALDFFSSVEDAKYIFSELLNYELTDEHLPTRGWSKELVAKLVDRPQVLCYTRGFRIVYLHLKDDQLLRGVERNLITRIMREAGDPYFGLFIVSNEAQDRWELVNVKDAEGAKSKRVFRRIPIGQKQGARTVTERLALVDLEGCDAIPSIEIQRLHDKAFDVEQVTKEFYHKVSNWYFWVLKHPGVKYPRNVKSDAEKSIFFIRLLTRLIFCWFVREKGLIPPDLFQQRYIEKMLKDNSLESGTFYKAFLQNLFFGTLNQEVEQREFRKTSNGSRDGNRGATNLYRYKDLLTNSKDFLALLRAVPFVNGGLFDCLDEVYKTDEGKKNVRLDDFSEEKHNRLCIPNDLFLGPEREINLSDAYGDKKRKKERVSGLLRILNQYQFTIEENTPLDQAVALDPELLGKVFENLLASYNEETKTTARKSLGAFYTPREIVNYMVDESLIAHLQTAIGKAHPETKDTEKHLRVLFADDEQPHGFTDAEVNTLILAIDSLKAIDPAVGSGAFPMGMLHKLVFLLRKIDPHNKRWKQRQLDKLDSPSMREDLEHTFQSNDDDYGRKLYLIENCIYGVDIQPVAVQIARMRFFISLIVDQTVDSEAPNQGVVPLPNLETKFVAANVLIGIDRPGQQILRNLQIDEKQDELRKVRERFFTAKTPTSKKQYRQDDAKLRGEIADMLKTDGWDNATAKLIAAWDPYDQNASAGFFDPEWMFGISKGFDVVIGNPPYLSALHFRRIYGDDLRNHLNKIYKSATGAYDYFVLFMELGLKLCCDRGYLCFITPNKYLAAKYAVGLRNWLREHTSLMKLLDVSAIRVFETAAVYPVVSLFCKDTGQGSDTAVLLPNAEQLDVFSIDQFGQSRVPVQWLRLLPENIWVFLLSQNVDLLPKIMKASRPLSAFGEVNATSTAAESDEYGACLTTKHISDSMKVVNTGTIDRYVALWGIQELTHKGERFLTPYLPLSKSGVTSRRRSMYQSPKIIFAKISKTPEAIIDTSGDYASLNTNCFYDPKPGTALKYIGGVCNSRMFMVAYDLFFAPLRMSGGYYQFQAPQLRLVPIPIADRKQQEEICLLVDRILSAKQRDMAVDTSKWEGDIDEKVFRLYGLTPDEIKIVEAAEK